MSWSELQQSASHGMGSRGSQWLTLGFHAGAPVLSDERVLAAGLEPADDDALVREALGMERREPSVLICDGRSLAASMGPPLCTTT